MGRKKNPFLVIKHEYKGKGKYNTFLKENPWQEGRIYDYKYIYTPDDEMWLDMFKPIHPYDVLMPIEEAKKMNKENDVSFLSKQINEDRTDGMMWVKFTPDEFKSFKRTKILENNEQ